MSEATTRLGASRGRGASRGGRGGFSNRGGRSSIKPNGESTDAATPSAFDEDSDIVELRKLYGSKVEPIKDMFQGWSDVDILYALQETDGDENLTVERIAHGKPSFLYCGCRFLGRHSTENPTPSRFSEYPS